MNRMKQAVHFGAGVIGRGFIGDLLSDSGFEITFVDVDKELLSQINKTNSYDVYYIDRNYERKTIEHVNGISPIDDEEKVIKVISECDILTTSVWADNLPKIANVIVKGLLKRKENNNEKLNVLACENALFASNILKKALLECDVEITQSELDQIASFSNTSVDRMVFDASKNGKKIVEIGVEFELVIEQFNLIDPTERPIEGAIYTDNLQKYLERKIYIINCAHAIAGYLGYLKGYEYVQEAFDDTQIYDDVFAATKESAAALSLKYNFDMAELEGYINFAIGRFMTPGVKDPITRVARSPIRKLGETDRLVGPALICQQYGLENQYICKGIAAALLFRNPEDPQAVEIEMFINENGIEQAITHFTKLESNSKVHENILHFYNEFLSE